MMNRFRFSIANLKLNLGVYSLANNQQNSLAQLIDQEGIKQSISGVNKNAFAQPYLANAVYTSFFSHHFNIIAEVFAK